MAALLLSVLFCGLHTGQAHKLSQHLYRNQVPGEDRLKRHYRERHYRLERHHREDRLERHHRASDINKTQFMINKIEKLRQNFRTSNENPHNGKKICFDKKHTKRRHKSKKRKICQKQKKTRYYTENGKYKKNKKFDSWAKELKKLWGKVKMDSSCSCGKRPAASAGRTRIVNGQEAQAHSHPWIVAMMTGSEDYYCGGSIISDQWILTAAHCVHGEKNHPAKDMYVRVGDHDIPAEDEAPLADTFQVDYYVHHARYDEESTNNDIALLKLTKKIMFSKYEGTVAPVCLPDLPRKYYGETVTVSGWGLLSDGGKTATVLQEVDLTVLWMKECREEFKYKNDWITSKMMCTFSQGQDACQGDSGGPLTHYSVERARFEQVGVVSWGMGCASPKYPGVFVKMSHYLRWVLGKVGKSTFCSG